ncbi:MAG: hypothetical protein JRN45_00230 [Nitrososphaerota archaeon]|nr:hypothetical protein [Nitrososphaerota archaeon]
MDESDEEHLTDEKPTYSETNSVRGAASLSPRQMAKALGGRKEGIGRKETNMLNAVSRDTKTESLQLRIRGTVGGLGVGQRLEEAIQGKAEQYAQQMRSAGMAECDVAFTAVAKVMRDYGWSFEKIVEKAAAMDRRIAAVNDLRLSVLPDRRRRVMVKIGGWERTTKAFEDGTTATRLLRVPLYATDDGELLELKGAVMCTHVGRHKSGGAKLVCVTEERRLDVLDARRAVVRTGRSFEMLKLMERVKLSEGVALAEGPAGNERTNLLLKRYWTEKLPLTEYLLANVGALMRFRTRYSELFREKFDREKVGQRLRDPPKGEPLLRTPRLLAREALAQADKEVFECQSGPQKTKVRRLAEERGLRVEGFVVWSELKGWEA